VSGDGKAPRRRGREEGLLARSRRDSLLALSFSLAEAFFARVRGNAADRSADGGYTRSAERKARAKLNFPWRDQPGYDATADPMQSEGCCCIAVGGLAIELRSDRCTLVYPYMKLPLVRPLPFHGRVSLPFSISLSLSLSCLPQCTNNAATSDRMLTRGVLKVPSAREGRRER